MELSVIIPVRNGAGTLGAQLDALLAQSWVGAWEIVVVDNGSTDATCELVRAYAERDHRVRLVSAPAANGAGAVRNAGAARAHGNAYAFADADDVVGPTWVASIGEALRDHVAVAGRLEVAELNPAWLVRTRGTRLPTEAPATFHGCFAMLPAGNFGMQATVWKELGGFDESVVANEDAELSLRVWQRRIQVHYAPDAVVHYRYRREPSVLFRQGLRYGTYRVLVAQRARAAGVRSVPRFAGRRSWLTLLRWLPRLRTPEGRASWCWIAGHRLGTARGCVQFRTLYL